MYFSWLVLQRENADYIADTTESCTKISIDNSLPSMLGHLHFFSHKKLGCMSLGHKNQSLYTVLTSILWKTFYLRFAMGQLKDGLTSRTGRYLNLLTHISRKQGCFLFLRKSSYWQNVVVGPVDLCGHSWVVFFLSWSVHWLSLWLWRSLHHHPSAPCSLPEMDDPCNVQHRD